MSVHMLNTFNVVRSSRKPQIVRAGVVPNAFHRRHRRAPHNRRGGSITPGTMDLSPLDAVFDISPAQMLEAEELMGIERARAMAVDFVEDSNGFQIMADIPGVQKQDIKLDVDHNVLTISAKRSSEKSDVPKATSESSETSAQVVNRLDELEIVQNTADKIPEGKRNVLRYERFDSFESRSFRVPKTADLSSILAKYDNGVLTVCIDKKEDVVEQKRSVTIA